MTGTTTQWHGLLGDALDANLRGRLSHFIVDDTSPAIALFAPSHRALNREGDWYGEHAGKWLSAAAKAAARSGDAVLRARVLHIADYLVSIQEPDGYLGTYAPDHRFMRKQAPKPVTWDGAPSVRTWDIWVHAYLVLGLLDVQRLLADAHAPTTPYLDAARRIGDLCIATFVDGADIDITELGNHHGLSATVLMDPAVELFFATGERSYLALAERVLEQANRNPQLALLDRALAGVDAADIATGKAYQLAWNLVGLAKLHRATGIAAYLDAVQRLWTSIRTHHLTLGGGPWGGVALRSREVFNAPGVFSPYGYVETCSTLAWIQLNRELLAITRDAMYAEEIERTAYNDLIGAQAPDGEDWCYYVFPNGRRVHTTYWRCCKSSGAMALEELPGIACGVDAQGTISIHLHGDSDTDLVSPEAGRVRIEQRTRYPYDGNVRIRVIPQRAARFALRVRIPSWATDATLRLGDTPLDVDIVPGQYATIERIWQSGDELIADFPMTPRLHRASQRNVQESRAPDGSAVHQEVMRFDYFAITCGPLVYATGLVDGDKIEESLRVPDAPEHEFMTRLPPTGDMPPRIELRPDGHAPLVFEPYFLADGRRDGGWRLTWMPLVPGTRP